MTTLCIDLLDPPVTDDVSTLFDRAAHYTIETVSSPAAFPMLRGIIFSGTRYDDKCAACNCRKFELYKFGTEAYTRCAAHGVLSIGPLHRVLTNWRAR